MQVIRNDEVPPLPLSHPSPATNRNLQFQSGGRGMGMGGGIRRDASNCVFVLPLQGLRQDLQTGAEAAPPPQASISGRNTSTGSFQERGQPSPCAMPVSGRERASVKGHSHPRDDAPLSLPGLLLPSGQPLMRAALRLLILPPRLPVQCAPVLRRRRQHPRSVQLRRAYHGVLGVFALNGLRRGSQ